MANSIIYCDVGFLSFENIFFSQVDLILRQFEGIKQGYLSNSSLPVINDLGFL